MGDHIIFVFLFFFVKQILNSWTRPARTMRPSGPLPPRSEPNHELALSRGSSTVLEHATASEAQRREGRIRPPLLSCCSWQGVFARSLLPLPRGACTRASFFPPSLIRI